jgi:hypothetical protein
MDLALLVTLAAVVVVLALAVGLAWALVTTGSGRRRLEQDLAATRAEVAALQDRLDELVRRPAPAPDPRGGRVDYVITSLPEPAAPVPDNAVDGMEEDRPSRREFASIALTESVVKVVSLTHGVRRALAPETRNRIRFEMGREVKRSRRQRRRDDKLRRRRTPDGPDRDNDRDTDRDTDLDADWRSRRGEDAA